MGLIRSFKGLIKPTSFNILTSSVSVKIGTMYRIPYIVLPKNTTNQEVKWTSSNTNIATVSNGIITPVAVGTTTITGTTDYLGFTDTISIEVYVVPVTGITLNESSITVDAGNTFQLVATVSPSDAGEQGITWSSSNTSVATVSSNGLVTYVGDGDCTITATTVDGGYTDTCSVTCRSGWEPDANTIVWYKLDGNANDSSGNNRNGSYPNGTPTWDMNAGEDGCWNGGKAVRFPSLGSYNVFTVSLWVKGAGVAFYLTDYGSGDRNNMDASVGSAGGSVSIWNGSSSKRQGWGATALADLATTRHNVIFVKNNSNWAGYVDGQKVGTWSNGTTIKMNSYSQIGYHPTSSSTGSGDRWVDNFIIQKNAWGDSEALDYYNRTKIIYQ